MGVKVKRIRDESEYKTSGGSDFIGLDEGEKFTGYALFAGDPKEDETGFFPYKMHWNGKTSVPCADEDCMYCEDGEKPRSKAYTLWLVLKDEAGNELGKNGEGELRIFDMPVTVIKQINEYRSEGEPIMGRAWRVSRPDEKSYMLAPLTAKEPLKKTAIKELLKSDEAPDFEAMLTSKLKKSMEGVAVKHALEEDDDDEPTTAKKGKGKSKDEEDEPTDETGEWPDALDEETVTVRSVDDDGNYFVAVSSSYDEEKNVWTNEDIKFDFSELSKGDEVTISADLDDDGDYILTAEPEVEGGGGDEEETDAENNLPDSMEDIEAVVTGHDADQSTFEVETEDFGAFTLWLLDTVELDFDDYKDGTKVLVTAEKDRAGDMVATSAPEIVKAKKAATKTSAKKGSTKKASTKKKSGKGK